MALPIQLVVFATFSGVPDLAFLGGIGSTEILMMVVVMLLLFGPKQLPELAKTIGTALRGIRKATDEMKEEIGFDDLVNPRPRRARNYRPPANVPPSLKDGLGPPAGSRQVTEEDVKKAFAAQPPSPNPLPDPPPPAEVGSPTTSEPAPPPDPPVEAPEVDSAPIQPEERGKEEPES